ncbi:MAG: NAD(P)H-dependent glycerol-3-phosphate dehydrogenase [Bacillota bacterium]
MSTKISIVGAGSWGTAIATLLANKGCDVKLWVRRKELLDKLYKSRINEAYLPSVKLPENVSFTNDMEEGCKGREIIVLATPSHIVRETAEALKYVVNKQQIIVNLAKGIENGTLLRMSEVIEEVLPDNRISIMSGPCHAEEVAQNIPTAIVSTARDRSTAEYIQDIFMTPRFRVYTNPDLIGVELGGALKNIIALGAGIIDGLGFGDNTKAALMTRGIVEMARLGESLGASRLTFGGLSGIGDLIVTCTSMHSRNRKAGIALGQGKKLDEILSGSSMVIEGIRTTKSAYFLAQKQGVEMPITEEIYNLLYNDSDIKDSVENLMMRSKTHEIEDIALFNSSDWGTVGK